ncbi:MAG: hypothetical protein K6L73_03105 [Cellvibrionaceae bacterium]
MGNQKNTDKSDLLDELESIKGLLEEEIPVLEDAIPILEDAVTLDAVTLNEVVSSDTLEAPKPTEDAPVDGPIPTLDAILDYSDPEFLEEQEPEQAQLNTQSNSQQESEEETGLEALEAPLKTEDANISEPPQEPAVNPSPTEIQAALNKDPSVLPGQQSLFDLAASTKDTHNNKVAPQVSLDETHALAEEKKPALQTPIKASAISKTANDKAKSPSKPTAPPLENQLASDKKDHTAETGSVREMAEEMLHHPLGENPFLPQHIRDRLSSTHKALEKSQSEQLATTHTSTVATQPKPTASTVSKAPFTHTSNHEKLVDDLVAEYLPKIEAELRKRLSESLAKSTASKDSTE